MKTLIVEDDFTSRKLLHAFLNPFGECDVAVNSYEAVEAFHAAHDDGTPYDLICLDIMLPDMNGHKALAAFRSIEERKRVEKPACVIMTTCLKDKTNVLAALNGHCEGYLVKPVSRRKLVATLVKLRLIEPSNVGDTATGDSTALP